MQEYKAIIVALKSASIGSKIHLFYIWLLVKHSTVSSGGLGKITKNQNQLNKGVLLGFISLWKTKKICACHHIDLFLKNQKNIINSNCSSCLVLLNFMQQFTHQQYQNKLWKYLLALIFKVLTQTFSQLIIRGQPLILPPFSLNNVVKLIAFVFQVVNFIVLMVEMVVVILLTCLIILFCFPLSA